MGTNNVSVTARLEPDWIARLDALLPVLLKIGKIEKPTRYEGVRFAIKNMIVTVERVLEQAARKAASE